MKSLLFFTLMIFGSLITSSHPHIIIPPNQSLASSKLLLSRDTNGLQENVTWDKYSMPVNGKRLYVYSGGLHPWRLPAIDLWLDILHKLKALGYNAVSVYIHWGLFEAEQGVFNFNGIFDWEPFFDAIKKVGLYVIIRPGPYINAELSAGGFPGWRQHAPEGIYWRVSNEAYYEQTTPYINEISQRLAPYQITNGGPIVLFQLENELSVAAAPGYDWPANQYTGYLRETFIVAGINAPLIHNDVVHNGYYASSEVIDIYTYDTYPITCSNWNGALTQGDWDKHLSFAPGHPHFLGENGGRFYAQWTDANNNCPSFMDPFVFRLMYKNRYSIKHTTYDFTTAISEDRSMTREKYSEMKLQAHLFAVSPAFITTRLQKIDDTYVVVLYGSPGDIHETAFTLSGKALLHKRISNGTTILNYNTTAQSVVAIGPGIKPYLLDKFEAYKFWTPALSCGGKGNIIVKVPYLVRDACIIDSTLHISGDTNATVPIEVIASSKVSAIKWNYKEISTTRSATGSLVGLVTFGSPEINIPVLSELEWKSINSLPEVTLGYDDSKWVHTSNTTTVNGVRDLTTPMDLYSETYGNPRGIWNYNFGNATTVTWKIQGNHGGQNYADKTRGPYNEGGTYTKRKGFHQLGVDTTSWPTLSPFKGTETASVQFYTTEFELKLILGYDMPVIHSDCLGGLPCFDFCERISVRAIHGNLPTVSNFGPQHLFPAPEGILNYQGENTVRMVIWAQREAARNAEYRRS
ncbi:glycoside hydrolase superfamily [Morchella snyderi]|nr:glycoside hydrolase superfamily [Morchella snyderi]